MPYHILKIWVRLSLWLFHGRHQVVGREHIPKKGAVIFAANHQNALLDALNLVCFSGRPPYFATRADLFQKAWVRRVLLYLRMYPVYRLRDGRANMRQNEEAFGFFAQKLAEGKAVGIFPEGQGAYQYRLLPLKKGLARLAFKVLEENPGEELYILPSGLHYERRNSYQSDMLLQFRQPLRVNDYWDAYQQHKARAIRQLTLDTHAAITEVLLHIEAEENYEALNQARTEAFRSSKGSLHQKFLAAKEAIRHGHAQTGETAPAPKHPLWLALLLPTFPLWLPHYAIRKGIDAFTHQKIKDSQFLGSVKFILGWLVFSLFYVVLGLIILIFLPAYYLLALPLVPVLGQRAYRWL